MTLERARNIFKFAKLEIGNEEHILARDILRMEAEYKEILDNYFCYEDPSFRPPGPRRDWKEDKLRERLENLKERMNEPEM